MGDESGEAEAEGVGFFAGPLEVLPGRVGHEAFDYVARLWTEDNVRLDSR